MHSPEKSIVNGPISYRNLWSGQKRAFTGPSNRAVFNKSLQDMYGDLYNKAKDMQTYCVLQGLYHRAICGLGQRESQQDIYRTPSGI